MISIHMLDNDSLLHIFYLCQPVLLDEASVRISQGGNWDPERWWYTLARVCQRWRTLVLESPNHLRLHLLCTYGTPVADMLENSPLCPLILDYKDHDHGITAEEEGEIMLALQHHDRVHRIRLELPFPELRQITLAMGNEFPILDFLHIAPLHNPTAELALPFTFQAPNIRHLTLVGISFPTISPLLATVENLVTLSLQDLDPSAYFRPDDVLQILSHLHQLDTLTITFRSPVPTRDVGVHLSQNPITRRVTLPNLRWFWYGGISTYLEALLPRMTIPCLEWFQITLFHELSYFTPNILSFLGAAENLKFGSAEFQFSNDFLRILVYPHDGASLYAFAIQFSCIHLDWQVESALEVFRQQRTIFSAVEYLNLEFMRSHTPTEAINEADCTQWRELLRTFSNVKTLRVNDDYLGQISGCLQANDGEPPLELLPELKKLEYYANSGHPFATFADARITAGHPVALVNHSESALPFRNIRFDF